MNKGCKTSFSLSAKFQFQLQLFPSMLFLNSKQHLSTSCLLCRSENDLIINSLCYFYCMDLVKYFADNCRLSLGTSFEKDATAAVLDLTGDDADEMRRDRTRTVWSVIN